MWRTYPSRVLAVAIAAPIAIAYLIISPPAADLAAASYRSDLFARAGLTLWDNAWYGGHHLLGYSLLAPALGSIAGPRLVLALSAVVGAALFASLLAEGFEPDAARAGACAFALGVSIGMLSGRVPFYLGMAFGMAALLAAARGHTLGGCLLALATSCASPVAGAFLALAAVAAALVRPDRVRWALVAAAALAPVLALAAAFPEGGFEPFAASSFWPVLVASLLAALIVGRRGSALRNGGLLYSLLLIAAYAIRTPLGGNAARLGALVAAPLVIAAMWKGRRRALLLVLPLLLYWQLVDPVRDAARYWGDPASNAGYYAPLLAKLRTLTRAGPARVEVVPTAGHWESDYVADDVAANVLLARGWERQLDERYDNIFYSAGLAPGAYRVWLHDNGVAYVALSAARPDTAARAEARLVPRARFLHEIWHSARWRLYAVVGARPLAPAPAQLLDVGSDDFRLRAPHAGRIEVRIRFTPYWAVVAGHGCVARAPGGWTAVTTSAPETIAIATRFSLARVLGDGPRCS